MKTAVDIIVELQQQYMKNRKVSVKDIQDKIHEYAIRVAIETLQEAISELNEDDFVSTEAFLRNQMSILSAKIETP